MYTLYHRISYVRITHMTWLLYFIYIEVYFHLFKSVFIVFELEFFDNVVPNAVPVKLWLTSDLIK